MTLIKGENCLKKENEGGEKTESRDKEFVFVKKKAVQKTDSSNNYFEENKSASSNDDFEKNKSAHGNENEHIEEDMKRKGIELRSLIIEPLSDEECNKISQIIKNKEAKSGEIYIHSGNEKVSWGSMQRLLKNDTKNHPKRWIDNKVINFYCKNYLAEIDQKQCQEEPERNCSGFLGSYFWQTLTDEKNNDMKVQGKYNYINVSKWSKKMPGKDIFNLKKIFILINIENQHWTCIVIFMKEKQIQYYDSHTVGAGNSHMNDVLRYLVDEDKGQGHVKREEWTLVPSTETVPKQENTIDCGAFICMFGYFISQDASLEFSQADVTNFRK